MITKRTYTIGLTLGLWTILSCAGLGWFLLGRQTAPRTFLWLDHHNKPVFAQTGTTRPEVPSCRGEPDFQTLTVDNQVWTVCAQGVFAPQAPTRWASGVYVRFDLVHHVAQAFWPLPTALAHFRTLGILPLNAQTLGIVYRANHALGPLAVAITNHQGWLVPPTVLPEPHGGRLLGMRWHNNSLQFWVTSRHVMDRWGLRTSPYLVSLSSGSGLRFQEIPRQVFCQNQSSCRLVAAYSSLTSSDWHVLVATQEMWDVTVRASSVQSITSAIPNLSVKKFQASATTATTRLLTFPPSTSPSSPSADVAASPSLVHTKGRTHRSWQVRFQKRPDLNRYLPWLHYHVHFAVTGALPTTEHTLQKRWDSTGTLHTTDSLAGWRTQLVRQRGHFVFQGGQLHVHDRWLHGRQATIHRLDQHRIRLALQMPKTSVSQRQTRSVPRHRTRFPRKPQHKPQQVEELPLRPVSLVAERIETWRTVSLGTISRHAPTFCSLLAQGTWVPRPQQQGFWLVSTTGCHISVDRQGKRMDNLSMIEHLQERSEAFGRKRPAYGGLLWLLIGGPLGLVLLGLIQRRGQLSTMDSAFSPPLWIVIVVVGLVVVSGLYLWWLWWPILSLG